MCSVMWNSYWSVNVNYSLRHLITKLQSTSSSSLEDEAILCFTYDCTSFYTYSSGIRKYQFSPWECLKVHPSYQINNSFPCLPLTSQTNVPTYISTVTEGTSQHHRTVNSISTMFKVLWLSSKDEKLRQVSKLFCNCLSFAVNSFSPEVIIINLPSWVD